MYFAEEAERMMGAYMYKIKLNEFNQKRFDLEYLSNEETPELYWSISNLAGSNLIRLLRGQVGVVLLRNIAYRLRSKRLPITF